MPKMIGLSVSLCISAIARGEVKQKDVSKIVSATMAPTFVDFMKVLTDYSESYWSEFPAKACRIALQFYEEGLIDQPRTRGEKTHFIGDGIWMDQDKKTFRLEKGQRKYSGKKLSMCDY